MQFNVKINGKVVPIHAKNEGQLSFAIAAMRGACLPCENEMKEVQDGTPNDEQDGTVNSASIGRPYIF